MRGNCTSPRFFLEPREQIELIAGLGALRVGNGYMPRSISLTITGASL